jgi:hypothetical protein
MSSASRDPISVDPARRCGQSKPMSYRWFWRLFQDRTSASPAEAIPETVKRQLALGIYTGRWLHSGTSCYEQLAPTQADRHRDRMHRAASGQLFDLADGLPIDGRYVFPGQQPGCHCVVVPIVENLQRR